ncbi:MAG TPA: AMP-binding protein [Candidatus Dormibacteraeota bacterium]|nr:AMP-binding protein [Candidatus Dormibacteraeota bacterium]
MDFDFLARHAEDLPDKPAVILGDRSVDFATLNRRANQAAHVFRHLGLGEDDRAAVMSFNSLEYFELVHGLRKIGAIYVPINYRLRDAEAAYVINDSGARVVVADRDHVPVLESARSSVRDEIPFLAVDGAAPNGWLDYPSLRSEADDQLPAGEGARLGATMIYTSGTTGAPKGAWRPNGLPLENLLQIVMLFELSQSDVHLLCGPVYHSGPGIFTALHQVLGSTVVVQRKFDPENALDLIERDRVTTTFMAPTLLARLVDAQEMRPRDVSSLRALILSAAPCPYALKVRAHKALGEVLWETYAATETGFNTVLRPEDQLRKPGSCGTAIPGQEIRLVRDDGTEAAVGEPGEFMVRSTWVAEYFNRPDATSRSTRDGFFTVGDVAYRDEEGYYYICDRRIDMIISGGVNIYPAEIEAVLLAHADVMDAGVIGVPDDEFGESVKAVVQLRPGATLTADDLIAFCAERLAGYKKPRSVDFVDELPRDAAGKLLKRKLRERYWAGAGRTI